MSNSFSALVKDLVLNAHTLKVLYQERERLESEILAFPGYGNTLATGNEIVFGRFTVRGEILNADQLSKSEKRNLRKMPDGRYLKIKVSEKMK